MKLKLHQATTGKLARVFIQNVSTGAGLTGLVYNTAGLTAYYAIEGASADVAIALSAGTKGTWSSGGFVEFDATNMPGVYELGLPNLMLASGASVIGYLQGAASMLACLLEIELDQVNYQSTTAFVASVPTVAGVVTANTTQWGGTSVSGMPLAASTYVAPPSSATITTSVVAGMAAAPVLSVTNPVVLPTTPPTGYGSVPLTGGAAVVGSTASAVIVSGLPSGRSYATQRLLHVPSGEARVIVSQAFASGNYTFTLGSGAGELGPFSAAATAGDIHCPLP
jgi:hypothetical protein